MVDDAEKHLPKYVLAANYQRFRQYCQETGQIPDKNAYYISNLDQLRGRRIKESQLVKFGDWYSNKEYEHLDQFLPFLFWREL